MNTIEKDKRRKYEAGLQNRYHEGWLLSLKYSNILMDNIDSKNLYLICSSIHGEYTHQLKINGLNNKKNYMQVWDTMLNTVYDKKNKNNPKSAVKLLQQTSQQRVSIFQ